MARLFTDGAEFGDFWYLNYGATREASYKRSGNYSWFFNYGDSVGLNLPNLTTIFGRFAFYGATGNNNYGSIPQIFYSGSSTPVFRMNFTGNKLQAKVNDVQVAVGNTYVSPSIWHVIEFRFVLGTSGIIQVKLNGAMEIDWTGNTNPSSHPYLDQLWFNNTVDMFLDDIAFNDTSGSVDNSWCGDGHVIYLPPNAAGDSTQWFSYPTGSVNYTCVDEFPPNDDTDYVYNGISGSIDFYNVTNPSLPTGSFIQHVWAVGRAKNSVADGSKFALGIKSGSTVTWGADHILMDTYGDFRNDPMSINPDTGQSWSLDDINNLQVGIKVL